MTQEQEQQLTEFEICLRRYFNMNIKTMMVGLQREMNHRQGQELMEHLNSPEARVQMSLTNDPFAAAWGQEHYVRQHGEWSSKTTEDYVEMCRQNLKEGGYAHDITVLANEWREQVISIIGKEAYDEKSRQLGSDLADNYIAYRLDGMMINHLAEQRVPKSTMDYVLGKAFGDSLVGTLLTLDQTPLDRELSEMAEDRYNPSLTEKGIGMGLAFGADVATTFGFSSWASVGKLAVTEVALHGAVEAYDYFQEGKQRSVEEYISQGVFGKEDTFLSDLQKKARSMDADECYYAYEVESKLHKSMCLMSEQERRNTIPFYPEKPDFTLLHPESPPEDVHVPFVPGYNPETEEYLQTAEVETKFETMSYEPQNTQNPQKPQEPQLPQVPEGSRVLDEEIAAAPEQQTGGWGSMLSGLGLDGLGDIGRNMGYVISMLPDVMVGMFTGKTQSLGLKDNMLPLASILVGMFVKNPLLKMVLIGMGGVNLLNKAGHEAIHDQKVKDGVLLSDGREYKRYDEEPLNSRIQNPEIRGNALFAVVDGVPCTVNLPQNAVNAWQTGALPLNTLANAVLAKSDEMSRMAQERYEENENRGVSVARGV